MHVTDDSEVCDLENWRVRILVDGNDVLRALHTDHVLRRTGDAARHVDKGLHGFSGLAHLVRIRNPTSIDDGAARARRAVEQLRELFDQRVRAGLAESTPTRHHDCRFFELRPRALFDVGFDSGKIIGRAEFFAIARTASSVNMESIVSPVLKGLESIDSQSVTVRIGDKILETEFLVK